jgi:hypothetical protein
MFGVLGDQSVGPFLGEGRVRILKAVGPRLSGTLIGNRTVALTASAGLGFTTFIDRWKPDSCLGFKTECSEGDPPSDRVGGGVYGIVQANGVLRLGSVALSGGIGADTAGSDQAVLFQLAAGLAY